MKRMFGERLGKCCSVAMEIAAGETDLVADRVGGQATDPNELYAAQKRSLTTSRMIASQAVLATWPLRRWPCGAANCRAGTAVGCI